MQTIRALRRITVIGTSALVRATCSDPQSPEWQTLAKPSGTLQLLMSVGSKTGDTINVSIGSSPSPTTLVATYGRVSFDPTRLRFLGQPIPEIVGFPVLVVNPSSASQGELRVLAVDPRGLATHVVQMAFEVLRDGYENSLRYEQLSGETREGVPVGAMSATRVATGQEGVSRRARIGVISGSDWYSLGTEFEGLQPRLIDSVPTGSLYWDVSGNGGISVADVVLLSNWAVGNEAPVGTPVPVSGDFAELVGNVAPYNLPGLGEAADNLPPGWSSSCQRALSVNDVTQVAYEAVGTDRPVVGELIPSDAFEPITHGPRRGTTCASAMPPVPNTLLVPDDSQFTITSLADSSFIYFRTMAEVRFKTTATGSDVDSFLSEYGAEIVGGSAYTGTYVVRYADPGSTWTAVNTRLSSMAAESFVATVLPLPRSEGPPAVDARYPNDTTNLKRADWIAPIGSDTTWALRAIRAPMAWGCEAGTYGGPRVKVGVIEYEFDATHPDLAESRTAPVFYASVGGGIVTDDPPIELHLWHGTATSGVLTATGDNQQGVAGVTWKTDLRLYNLYSINSVHVPFSKRHAFEQALMKASSDGIKVLSLSMVLRTEADPVRGTIQQSQLVEALRKFLNSPAHPLVVVSAGNANNRGKTAEEWAQLRGAEALRAALMTLRLESASYANRIVIVAGTQRSGSLWTGIGEGSNFYIGGATDIAAPGHNVALLGSRTAGPPLGGAVVLANGTSFAAPQVAGVAAQLLSMDPTLTTENVKDYLIRGAKEPRIDPATGLLVVPPEVSDAPGLYQLDAYSSLMLLSKERAGTPICGIEVSYEPTSDLLAGHVILGRNSPDSFSVPAPPSRGPLAVAQGGRVFALTWWNSTLLQDETREYELQNGQWVVRRTMAPQFARLYLEKDTVDWPHQFQPIILRGSQWGSGGTSVDLAAVVNVEDPDFIDLDWWVQVSPDAKYAVVRSHDGSQTCGNGAVRVWMVTLPSGPAQSLEGPTCRESAGLDRDAAWNPTGQRTIIGVAGVTAIYRAWTISNGVATAEGPPVSIPGRELGPWFVQHTTDPTGGTVQWAEGDASGACLVVTRRASANFTSLAQRANPMCVLPVRTLRAPGDMVAERGGASAATDTMTRRSPAWRSVSGGSR